MVLSGEVEILAASLAEEDEDGQQYDGFEEGDDDYPGSSPTAMDDSEDVMPSNPAGVFGHNNTAPADINVAHVMPRVPNSHGGPMIAQMPPSVSFENPAMPAHYEPQVTSHFSGAYVGHHHPVATEAEKVATWSANMYSAYDTQHLQLHAQRSMMTAPNSAHGGGHTTSPVSTGGYGDHAHLANLKRQQMFALQHQHNAMTYAVDGDDASSVGSSLSDRERSRSFSTGSGYGSPPHGASPGNYDMRTSPHINTGVSGSWTGRGVEGMNGMVMKQAMNPIINVGGGNGGGYGVMM
jgi:hypothetical protein